MKKRGLASLFIVSIIAIAAVLGVVFAFKNSGRQNDVYANISVVAEPNEINLNIEVVDDDSEDNGIMIDETADAAYEFLTITVGGLPSNSDRRVFVDDGAICVDIERYGDEITAKNTGVNIFKITGKKAGSESLRFSTIGDQSVTVKVKVDMVAKYMTIGKGADGNVSHFGIRQGGEPLELKSSAILSKFDFYAHVRDVANKIYSPNQYPVIYRLMEGQNYKGVTLTENGFLTVSEDAECVDQYIYLQAQVPAMGDEWVDVPVYVFPKVADFIITPSAYKAATTGNKTWDLIKNREGSYASADFSFELKHNQSIASDYGVIVESDDTTMVRVDPAVDMIRADAQGKYICTLSPTENLGTTKIRVKVCPIIKGQDGRDIEFTDESDTMVQFNDEFNVRVRYEFKTNAEVGNGESFNLKATTNKINAAKEEYLDAFFYEGGSVSNYHDEFILNTANGKVVNMDADVEFELLVEDSDPSGEYSGIYRRDGHYTMNGERVNHSGNNDWNLYTILDIGYWSEVNKNWVRLSSDNYFTHYKNKFSVAFRHTGNAEKMLQGRISSLILRVKSVEHLSLGDDIYATCDIRLERTCAIDELELSNLCQLDNGTQGVALVYDTVSKSFVNSATVRVKGLLANGTYSENWNMDKVLDNGSKLPFDISVNRNVPFEYNGISDSYYCIEYTIAADDIDAIDYYKDYPMTITYPNGISSSFNICVYPTVGSLSMPVVSGSQGKIYQTVTNSDGIGYDYARVVYVRKGYDYQFNVITPGVNVGASAEFDKIVSHVNDEVVYDENGKIIARTHHDVVVYENTTNFDATQLPEGLYECTVSLSAYSQDVYEGHDTEFPVYFIVVDPVGSVTPSSVVNLKGIGDSEIITLDISDLNRKSITSDGCLQIDLVEGNENILIEEQYNHKFNQYKITAKYLTNNSFKLGFKVYKKYDFTDINLDGKEGLQNEKPFVFNYNAGNSVTVTVNIGKEKLNNLNLFNHPNDGGDFVKDSGASDGYFEMISSSNKAGFEITGSQVDVKVSDSALNPKIGIAYAEWVNGKFEIAPFPYGQWVNGEFKILNNNEFTIPNVATVTLSDAYRIVATPVAGQKSIGQYAIVVYPCDSLRYVKTEGNVEYALPDLTKCKKISLYVASDTTLTEFMKDKNLNIPHDANSGRSNTLGGYNWIIRSQNHATQVAALTYTTGDKEYTDGDTPEANVYYFDDLYTVLGWGAIYDAMHLGDDDSVIIEKFVDGIKVGEKSLLLKDNPEAERNRLKLNLNDYKFQDNPNDLAYSNGSHNVYLKIYGQNAYFYLVEGIERFDVKMQNENSNITVAQKNLSPDKFTNEVDNVVIQRGSRIDFVDELKSGWKMDKSDFETDKANARSIDYEGGIYAFVPYIEFKIDSNITYKFVFDALRAKVKVDVDGGIKYLNFTQNGSQSDGVSTATYYLNVCTDQIWSSDLLNFTFLYEGVYYDLFKDNPNVAYINLEGGKAKLEFKLTCLNRPQGTQNIPSSPSFYINYSLQIDVAVVIVTPDVNPFYDINGSRLFVRENLVGSPLAKTKTPLESSTSFDLVRGSIENVTLAHFAETNAVAGNKNALTLSKNQTDSGIIYLDDTAVGGLLKVRPTPYYINVADIVVKTVFEDNSGYYDVPIGTDLNGNAITERVRYSIDFIQMIYNEDEGYYQPYLLGVNRPKMVSAWSRLEGYKWDGYYYFKTVLKLESNSQITYRVPNGTRFTIEVSITGENGTTITEHMTLFARYRDSFSVGSGDEIEDYPVRTMLQTQYQALGTTVVYDIAMPTDCNPNFAAFTLNGISGSTATIKSNYIEVTIDAKAKTLSVHLEANARAIGASFEVRIPYNRPGDYINPYLSVVIVPVYFAFDQLEVVDHYETVIQAVSEEAIMNLKYRASFVYDAGMSGAGLTEKMVEFNQSMLNSSAVQCGYDKTQKQISVNVVYAYVNGVPVLSRDGDCRYAQTFAYELKQPDALVKHKEYLAVGTTTTYTFHDWDPLHATKLTLRSNGNPTAISSYWNCDAKPVVVKTQNGYDISITVSLENRSNTVSNETAYDALVSAGGIVIYVDSSASVQPLMELTIVPVYFTFDEFKLQNNPVRPLVALSTPTIVTVEAGDITRASSSVVTTKINTFNNELLAAQENLNSSNAVLSFTREKSGNNVLNFDFNSRTRALTRSDLSNPVTATSYLLVTAAVDYVNGVPTLSRSGEKKISTYIPVRTFGTESENNGTSETDLEPAPNGRERTVAQAIGTKGYYNVALPNTVYDSKLDKYEIRADNTYLWEKNFNWNATLNTKEKVITVTLDETTALFNTTLVIKAYNQDGELMYKLNIIPAYFTVENIILAEHIDENPILIGDGNPNWVKELALDFKSSRSNSISPIIANFNFATYMNSFRQALNSSNLVARIDDSGYVTIVAGVNFENGIPTIASTSNSALVLQNTYRYELYDGVPVNTKAQAIGNTITYNVNRTYQTIKIFDSNTATWLDNYIPDGAVWKVDEVEDDNNTHEKRRVKVVLSESTSVIGHPVRIGIFKNEGDVEPDYILNIIPAYFTVEDLTVKDQNSDDRNIYLYYGFKPDSPRDLIFDPVIADNYSTNLVDDDMINTFKEKFQGIDAVNIVRDYDSNLNAGDLHVTAYLDYTTGVPELVTEANADVACVVRVSADFWYSVFGHNGGEGKYPYLPNGPRTRTEVQAVGTVAKYKIDLNQTLTMTDTVLVYDENLMAERGWKATFANNIFTLELLSDVNAVSKLVGANATDLVFKFYAGSKTAYVLTIQPVLFEVLGIESYAPEQPIYVSSDGDDALNTLMYRAVVKYNDSVQYKASESAEPEDVVAFINTLNNNLNTESRQFLNIDKVEINGKYYLKLDAAIDYGVAGSNRRRTPYLVDIESNPLNVVESYLEYIVAERPITTEAKHNQAIGTTEYYYLGSAFRNISQSDISVMVDNVVSASATATLVENYGGQDATALKVVLAKDEALVNQSVTVEINYLDGSRASTFTMEIQPVWFVVEGFEVVNHPERHMWLIISDTQEEKVSDLIYNARVRYAVDANNTLLEKIQTRIDAFNAKLVTSGEEGWADLLDIETIGSQYVEVRAAVKYGTDGVAVVEAINENNLSAVVYDVFKYNRYINKVKSSGIAYPNVPRSRTVEITVGYEADYTLDIPNLGALSSDLIALYYNDNRIYADDDSKLQRYTSEAVNHWAVSVVGNNLHVALHADIALANSELKVFVYKNRVYVPGENEKPNSFDIDKVAYILTIRPVLFKVTDFALVGYSKDEIHVADIDNFTKDISDGINTKFVPVYEYNAGLLDTVVDTAQGTKLVDLMNNFTDRFVSSPYVAKTRSSIENDIYQFQVTTSVIYNAYEGRAILSDDAEYRLWKSFKVVVENVPTNSTIRDEYQTIGSTKTYYIDDSVLTDTTTEPSGAGYTATWSRDDNDDIKKNYLNVTLDDSVTVGTPVMVEIGNCTLRINPVYYEVLGFEPVQHPERAAWVVEPETTDDLEYRMIITDISYLADDAFAGVRAAVNANIETWNLKLNNGEAPKTVNLTDGQLIVFDAAVNYDKTTGYPKFVEIDKDKRNVVESIIKYRVWSAAQMPNPEHPLVMGKSEAYQVLGKTKAYTLRNIRGQISYQYLWAESAGDLITAFDDSIDGVTVVYEKMTIRVDVALNIVKIQLPANPNIRDTMRVYIPYSTAINGKEVWYSYCLEITPILFELRGWTIAGISQKDGYPVTYTANHPDVIGLYVSHLRNDCILLTKQSDESTKIRYVALVNRSNDALLASQIDRAIAELEANAVTYINDNYLRIDKLTNYIVFNGDSLVRNYPAEQSSESEVTFSCYVVYRNGLPELVLNSNISVSNQILIATGSEIANFEDANIDRVFDHHGETVVQAVGTSATYTTEILNAVKIFTDQIEIWDCSDNNTHNPLQIRGERANLASFVVDDIIDENIVLTVDLAPVAGLCDKLIAVSIPYAKNDYALKPTDCYIIYIKPVIFTVEGFYLTGVEDNNLSLDEGDAVLELNVVANYSDEVSLRNFVNLNIQSFETALNNAIRNQTIVFDNVENIENVSGGINVHFQPMGNRILIQKIDDLTAVNTISKQIRIGYATGIPTVGGLDEMTDADIDLQIRVSTTETPKHIDLENMEAGESYQTLQSIGSSVPYPLSVTDPNVIFYYENIDVFKGGLKRGDNEYEFFHYEVISSDRRNVTLNVTLRAAARNLNDYIEIRIPYTKFIGDETHWFYYSLQIKPVLFEIKGWKVNLNGSITDKITLDDSAVELYFVPDIDREHFTTAYYLSEDLNYIWGAINRLEKEINTYDPRISDGYYYLVLNNTAQEGFSVNYQIYRDYDATYLQRVIGEASTTVMQVSANISYSVNDVSHEYVEGAQAVTAYANSVNSKLIQSVIEIVTTDRISQDTLDDHAKIFITNANADELTKMSSGVDYVLMEDIKISDIPGLTNGRWKPVDFPTNTTLDGNNFKLIFDAVGNANGFDLTDMPTNIGMFKTIPSGAVVKNLQIVFDYANNDDNVTTLEVDLKDYAGGQVNIGMLAGINAGIVTNCAIVSRGQFDEPLTDVINPVTGVKFTANLPFNKDGYLFDDNYFYELATNQDGEPYIINVYNDQGYGIEKSADGKLVKDSQTGKWQIEYDIYQNVKNWIVPDRTNVAKYDDYSPMIIKYKTVNGKSVVDMLECKSPAKLYVKVNNDQMDVTIGGLVGTNNYMITNSRVLIDVELWGPEQRDDNQGIDIKNVMNSVVGGVVGLNTGAITSTYFRDGNVINNANANNLGQNKGVSLLGGFVGQNTGTIQQSYAMGYSVNRTTINHVANAGAVQTTRNSLGGFAHVNSGTISNCLVNMVLYKTGTNGAAGGFVYQNLQGGKITNCIENNNITDSSGGTLNLYAPIVVYNGNNTGTNTDFVPDGITNFIYAGNYTDWNDDMEGVYKHLTDNDESVRYSDINNYEGFSMGTDLDPDYDVSANNTTWVMTNNGPMLREANEIAVSYRKTTWNYSPYLYNPGTAKNPYLVWNEKQFNNYTYVATAQATEGDRGATVTDIENNRQGNHMRLVDNITLSGIKDTYKIIYTGTLEGNGLTMSGINLNTVTNDLATMGLFGKTEYATIRNINFQINNINATARYVGGIAGIAINTNFVDVNVTSTGVIKGANIVGGVAGLAVVFRDLDLQPMRVENYNVHSNVSVTADFANGDVDPGAAQFDSGVAYTHQTLHAAVKGTTMTYTQGFGTAGGVFGFVTSNPNNYREVTLDSNGNLVEIIHARQFEKTIYEAGSAPVDRSSYNTNGSWFLKAPNGEQIIDTVEDNQGVYYKLPIVMSHISGAVKDIAGNVAGGLIGIMDETIELKKPSVTALNTLSGKYYLGGVVGINLGKISGAIIDTGKRDSNNNPITKNHEVIKLNSWTISSSAGKDTYVYRMNPSVGENKDQWFWGMTVGAVAGYNNGIYLNDNSGVIENITANVNVLGSGSSTLQYIIGGVVGVNGNYGYIDNAVNEDTTIKNATFTSATAHSAANSIGYHFGRIVGRGVAETNDPLDFRMKVIPVELPDNTAGHVLNKKDKDGNLINNFETKGYNYSGRVNAFGIDENTLKVQTMTMEEYYDYLKIVLKNKNLPFRIKKLQDWVRSLSTYTEQVEINHELVWVEKFNEEERIFLENWLNDNSIFDDRGGASVLANYQAYLRYSAVGVAGESESDFKAKIAKYRKARYDMAIEFFTYQDANTPSNSAINGSQNREFTWAQYEKYLILKKFATDQPLTPQDYSNVWSNDEVTRGFAQKYGEDVASLVYLDPTKGVFAEYKNNKTVMIYSQIDFVNMLRTIMNDENQFTNQDPLQVYLNYAVLAANGEQLLLNDGSRLTFAQYCYYMKHIYGSNYAPDFNYSVPKDFSATQEANKITCYLDYVSIQKDLDQKQTVPEFIDLIKRYEEIVTQKEFEWITTGHLGGGGARISTIGGIELDWADAAEWNNIVNAGKIEKGDNHSINYLDANQKWEALTEFAKAQAKGMDIHKYNEMINLGGNLYYFLYATDGNGNLKYTTVGANEETPADKYIFDLKCAQYGWSQAQINFVRDKYAQKIGDNQIVSYDTQYALAATTEGLISDYFGKGAIRAVKATDTQIMSDAVWFADNNGDTNKNDGEPAGVFTISGETYKNGDGQNYYVYVPYGQTERMIDLRANGIDGAALYVDVDENKMFGTVVSASGGSSDSHEAGKDILAVYELEPHKMNSSSSENYVFFHAVKIDGTVTWYDNYPSDFFTNEETKNDTLYGYYEKPDFYTADKKIDETTHTVTQISNVVFYKIARQIKEDSGRHQMTSDATEATGNAFDYLEEALWWRAQKFTVEQFDKLKAHAMIKSLSAGYGYVLPSNNYTTRETGFTLADDWTAEVIVGDKTVKSGFVNDQFTQAEYTEIALGGKYVGDTWYSNYADYKLFCMLNNPGTIPVIEIKAAAYGEPADYGKGIDPTTIKQGLPSTSEYRNPFASKAASNAFVDKIADENDLAEATELGSDHVAFLTLFRAGASAADYINWSLGQNGTDGFKYKIDENTIKYFRMNHYIYYVQNNLGAEIKIDGVSKFDAEDYRWVLNQDVRKEIQYSGVTPAKRTTDLVEYRMNWRTVRTDGTVLEFMTFRDYCEWINIYAYSSAYQIARGDYQDAETGETLTSTDGWLTIEAFAVWKRMEKYENNVEYLNKISTTAAQQIITAPIYKRKISTTVFPMVKPSGEQQRNSTTGMLESDKMTLEAPLSSKDYNDGKAEYEEKMYGENGYVNKSVALANAGKSMGMCETAMGVALATYNEVSSQYSSSYSNYQAVEDAKEAYDNAVAAYNAAVVYYNKLGKEIDKLSKEIDALPYKKICIDWYRWPYNAQPGMDVNYQRPYADRFEYNERYNIRQVTRFVTISDNGKLTYETLIDDAQFAKDPRALYDVWGNTGLAGYGIGSTAVGETAYIKLDETRNFTGSITSDYNEYAQLYIPYDYFETACQMIKSAYSGDYAGYHNYMKYWARNGNVNWICDQTAYAGELDDKVKVNYTYKQAGFWNNYKGTQSPVDGTDNNVSGYAAGDKKAYGWLVKEN